MKYLLISFALIFVSINSFCQEANFSAGDFSVSINNSILKVLKNDTLVYQKKFINPSIDSVDLDNDGINELELIDSVVSSGQTFYTFYIFSTIDSFYLSDSIYSGITAPYEVESDEVPGKIIITGNPIFDHFNGESYTTFSPINCWKYESGEVFGINDEIYDLFINENEDIIDYLDQYFRFKKSDCINSKEMLGAIAAGYANYINAGEESSAEHFLSTYYFCLDADKLKEELNRELKR